jgi:hypothetical protein
MSKPLDNNGKEIALHHLKLGKSTVDVTNLLTMNGYSYSEAIEFTEIAIMTTNPYVYKQAKRSAAINLFLGVMVLILGIGVLTITSGGFVGYGTVAFGASKFAQGIFSIGQILAS